MWSCHAWEEHPWKRFDGCWHRALTSKITSRQRPVFSATDEKVRGGHELWSVCALMMNGGMIVFHLYCCSKRKLSTILVRFAALTFWFKTLFKFCVYLISLYIIYDWINIQGCSKHELSTITYVVLPKRNLSYDTPTSPQRPLSSVPKVTVVERFDCTANYIM